MYPWKEERLWVSRINEYIYIFSRFAKRYIVITKFTVTELRVIFLIFPYRKEFILTILSNKVSKLFYPSNEKKIISILLPALNEEEGLKRTLYSIPKADLIEAGYVVDILVVDGNSTDKTREIAQEFGARVIIEKRRGYGRAYKTGFESSLGDIIVTLDADDTYPIEIVTEYVDKLIETESDFITTDRFSRMERGSMSLTHKLGNKVLSRTMNLLFSINVHDSQSGMWIMRRSFVDRINLVSDDMCLSEEIKIIAFKYFKSLEVAGRYSERTGSAKLATIRHGWRNLKYLFTYRKFLKHAVRDPTILTRTIVNSNTIKLKNE